MTRLCLVVLSFCSAFQFSKITAQCLSTEFNIPAEGCRNENIRLISDYTHDKITWDFCSGDLNIVPSAESFFQIPGAVGRPSLQLVKEEERWVGFATGTWTNSLSILEFGNGIDQAPTNIKSYGDLNGQLNSPGSLRMVKDDGVWYALIHNTGSRQILRVAFANDLSTVLEVSVLTSNVGYLNSGLAVSKDENNGWVGIISEADNTFTIMRFGNDLNPVQSTDILKTMSVPNGNNLGDIDLINVCGEWFGAAVNLGGGNVYLLEFGGSIFSLPAVQQIASLGISNGARLRFAREGEEFFLLVASLDGLWHTFKFGNSVHANPVIENQGNLNGTLFPETYALGMAKDGSQWTVLTIAQDNGQVYRVNYELMCSAVPASSVDAEAQVKYGLPGNYTISASAETQGQWSAKSKAIAINDNESPDIDLNTTNICLSSDIIFAPVSASANIQGYQWSFGDLTTSTQPNPSHRYADVGNYIIDLSVTYANGCQNNVRKGLSIYSEPLAEFSGESPLLCTNSVNLFRNETPDIYNGNLSYQWLIDDELISNTRDLEYVFSEEGEKKIVLVTSIPGCSNEVTKITSPIYEGPTVDFSFSGACEADIFSFIAQTSQPIESYFWDFRNGQYSTEANPSTVFAQYGTASVTLEVINDMGCGNRKTREVPVYAMPIIDFVFDGPSNTCDDKEISFENRTEVPDGKEVTQWFWEFGDHNDARYGNEMQASHLFTDPGLYNVSLTATTVDGCSTSAEKEVRVYPTPSAEFTYTPVCEDIPVSFSGAAYDEIASSYWEIGNSYYNSASPTHTFFSPGDYTVNAKFYGANGCIGASSKIVHVPQPLYPDFSVIKNCAGHEALFTDLTMGSDPVVSRQWTFGNGLTSSDNPATQIFEQAGTRLITLQVTSQSGCAYKGTKQIQITTPPQASFTASPASGAFPLEVSFTNTSSAATAYRWEFMDGSGNTSEEVSPRYIYSEAGSFEVRLIAYNAEQCEDHFTQKITTFPPLPDVDVELINVIPNDDGSAKVIVTIDNKGNTILNALPLTIDFGGVSLVQIVENSILPATKFNYVLNTTILDIESLRYLCVSLHLDNDINPWGNRMCKEFQKSLLVFPVYPNPASDMFSLEWISERANIVRITLIDGLGRHVMSREISPANGLNRHRVDLEGLGRGIYFLRVEDLSGQSTQRVIIGNRP